MVAGGQPATTREPLAYAPVDLVPEPPNLPPPRIARPAVEAPSYAADPRSSIQRPRRRRGLRLLGTLAVLGIGVAGGMASPYRLTDVWSPLVAPSASLGSVPPAPPSASAPAAPPSAQVKLTIEQQAAQGDPGAIAKLEAVSDKDRTVEQNTAIARGQLALRLAALEKLGARMKKNPAVADEPETLRALLEFARDPLTTFAAQELIAAHARPSTTDLLYEVWTGVPYRTPGTVLAERLVNSEAIRKHASPALAIALDLREVKECDKALELITRASEVADRRSVRSLVRMAGRRDCGDSGKDECFPCLNEPEAKKTLGTAAANAQKRLPPLFTLN